MKTRLLASLILLAVFAAACAPATSTGAPAQPGLVEPTATLPSAVSPYAASPATTIPTDALAPTALPVATSRGPELHATDPATVSLASGELQLVEFFRFT